MKGQGRILPLSVRVFLAVKTTGGASGNVAAPGPRLTSCHLLTTEKSRRKEKLKSQRSAGFRSFGVNVPVGLEVV